MKLVLSQNYFTFLNKRCQPKKGVATGSTVSNTIAEIFLQYFKDKHIKCLLNTRNITFYICYMDDMLIICDSKRMHHDVITANTNQMHSDIKFNPALENNGQINFLDLILI
jgi:hypothetical protein